MPEIKPRATWLAEISGGYVELPEPPQVQKYLGGQRTDVEAHYERSGSTPELERLKREGAALVSARFFSGFGLAHEKSEFERGRELCARAHDAGLRVAARVSLGWAIPETLIQEEPDSQNWMQLTHDGKAVWGVASFQCRPCYNSEGWLRFVEKAAGLAVDGGADLIFFDGAGYSPTVRACHCPLCVGAFRDFLRVRYGSHDPATRAAGQARFGHNQFAHVRPPVESIASQIAAPHQQEWILFKIRTVTDALARVARVVRRLNPQCAVGADVFDTFFAAGSEYLFGIDPAQWLPLLDAAFMREPRAEFPAGWADSDRIARGLNVRLGAKVARAFGALTLDALQPPPVENPPSGMAVFHDTPSTAFNSSAADSRHELEMKLLERGVGFDVLHAGDLANLKSYACVVLANCECLSDELAVLFENYVEHGGGLIVTEHTGRRDPWRRTRAENALARLILTPGSTVAPTSASSFNELKLGRVAYLPQTADDWEGFESAVKWLAGAAHASVG